MATDRLEDHFAFTKKRIGISVAIYLLFCGVALYAAFRPDWFVEARFIVLAVPFLGAVLTLPRDALPSRWEKGETPEEQDRIDMIRSELRALHMRSLWMRVLYLAIAGLLVIVVPRFAR